MRSGYAQQNLVVAAHNMDLLVEMMFRVVVACSMLNLPKRIIGVQIQSADSLIEALFVFADVIKTTLQADKLGKKSS